jgi:hypothetical protein
MRSNFSPNGAWTDELEDYAKRVERVQKGYVEWRAKQERIKRDTRLLSDRRSPAQRGLRRVLAWLKKIIT